jgi:hypothetical protein
VFPFTVPSCQKRIRRQNRTEVLSLLFTGMIRTRVLRSTVHIPLLTLLMVPFVLRPVRCRDMSVAWSCCNETQLMKNL